MTVATEGQNTAAIMSRLEAKRMAELARPDRQEAEFEQMLNEALASIESEGDEAEGGTNVDKAPAAFISPSTLLVTHYGFPETVLFEPDYEHLDDSALRQALQGLVLECVPYHLIRDRYIAIASIMNRRGACPPKFRPQRSLPRMKKSATDDDELMMRDRQVIDMHWLHCRGKRDIVPGKKFASIFVGDELDFDLAGLLASKGWPHEVKAESVLNLIPHEQQYLAILRSKSVANAWRNAERSMTTTVEKRLREQAIFLPALKPHIEDFKHLWLADRMIGKGKGRLSLVAQMHAWISGKAPLATSTLSEKLKRMRIRTAPRTGPVKGSSGADTGSENS